MSDTDALRQEIARLKEAVQVRSDAAVRWTRRAEQAEAERDSLRLELAASEHNRIKGNEAMIAERDALRAQLAGLCAQVEALRLLYGDEHEGAAWNRAIDAVLALFDKP